MSMFVILHRSMDTTGQADELALCMRIAAREVRGRRAMNLRAVQLIYEL